MKAELTEFHWRCLFALEDALALGGHIERLASLTDDDGDLRVLETLANCSRWIQEGLSQLANGSAPLMPYMEQRENVVQMLEKSLQKRPATP
jgi:hypothetical protein